MQIDFLDMLQDSPGRDEKGDRREDAGDAKHAEDGADGHEGRGRLAAAVPVERLPVDTVRFGFAARNLSPVPGKCAPGCRRVLRRDASDLVDRDSDDYGRRGEDGESDAEKDRSNGGRQVRHLVPLDS